MYSLPHIKCWEMGQTRGQRLGPTQAYECQMGPDLWTLVFPISKHFTHAKLYIFWTYEAIHLIWAYFWPPYKKSMTFSYFVLYFDSTTSYGYHVIYFFTPYNKRNNMTCITTKLKHFEFCNAWRGLIVIPGGGLYNTFHIISLEFHNQYITGNLSR